MSSASGEEEARRRQLAPGVEPSTDGLIWMQVFGFAFFPFVLLASLDRSARNDNAFLIACYGVIVSLLRCVYLRERTRVDLVGRKRDLNMAIWVLSALLVAMFTHRIALDMPLPVAVVLWCTTGLIIWGGFYALFRYRIRRLVRVWVSASSSRAAPSRIHAGSGQVSVQEIV